MKTITSLSLNEAININVCAMRNDSKKLLCIFRNNPATSRWPCKPDQDLLWSPNMENQSHDIYSATVYRAPKQENLTKIILVPRASIKVAKQLPLWMWSGESFYILFFHLSFDETLRLLKLIKLLGKEFERPQK